MEYNLLLHKDVYMPNEVIKVAMNLQSKLKEQQFSSHLKVDRLAHTDLKHNYTDSDLIKALERIKNEPVCPFEVGLKKVGCVYVSKYCVRVPYDNKVDICIAIGNTGKIITAWCNLKTDTHKTLRTERYGKKEDYLKLMR